MMSQSVQLLCLSLVVGLLLPVMSWGKDYSDSWAVEVEGGPEVAEVIARKHGFTNRGQVGNLKNVYHFELVDGNKEHLPEKTAALGKEREVVFVEQQHYRKMAKKGPW